MCRHYDFFDVGTGTDPFDPDTEILHLSGAEPPIPFKTPGNAMWMTFMSDYDKSQPGFRLSVTADEEKDGKVIG